MAFGTLNSILSTTVSITYTCCCAIVLMLHNVKVLAVVFLSLIFNTIENNLKISLEKFANSK